VKIKLLLIANAKSEPLILDLEMSSVPRVDETFSFEEYELGGPYAMVKGPHRFRVKEVEYQMVKGPQPSPPDRYRIEIFAVVTCLRIIP
jgi:hypothetical protein